MDVSKKNEGNLIKKLDATEKRFEFKDVTKTDVFQAKARLAEAVSKRIQAENNLDISVSDFKNLVGREPNINWYENENDSHKHCEMLVISLGEFIPSGELMISFGLG